MKKVNKKQILKKVTITRENSSWCACNNGKIRPQVHK